MKTIKLLKNNKEQGEILNPIKDYYEKLYTSKKQMKFHQNNIFLIKF
jgi:hypothetical protein